LRFALGAAMALAVSADRQAGAEPSQDQPRGPAPSTVRDAAHELIVIHRGSVCELYPGDVKQIGTIPTSELHRVTHHQAAELLGMSPSQFRRKVRRSPVGIIWQVPAARFAAMFEDENGQVRWTRGDRMLLPIRRIASANKNGQPNIQAQTPPSKLSEGVRPAA
jgi:hypothetical protein